MLPLVRREVEWNVQFIQVDEVYAGFLTVKEVDEVTGDETMVANIQVTHSSDALVNANLMLKHRKNEVYEILRSQINRQ